MAAPDYPGLDMALMPAPNWPSTGAAPRRFINRRRFVFPTLITRRRCLTSNVRGTFTPV